jgi:hypothetical protein
MREELKRCNLILESVNFGLLLCDSQFHLFLGEAAVAFVLGSFLLHQLGETSQLGLAISTQILGIDGAILPILNSVGRASARRGTNAKQAGREQRRRRLTIVGNSRIKAKQQQKEKK